ncbi:MAG: hypothetical protein HXY50_17195 [Ignavibacteriaceae bacterium]|nr:hypothetical protein [Ignavibacteriaceae bacterium]
MTWQGETKIADESAMSGAPSLAIAGRTIHVVWTDRRDGNHEIYYDHDANGIPAGVGMDPMAPAASGQIPLRVYPNPFVSCAAVEGRAGEWIAVHDATGRLMGTYLGDRVGEGLPPGVYFLRATGAGHSFARAVKLD